MFRQLLEKFPTFCGTWKLLILGPVQACTGIALRLWFMHEVQRIPVEVSCGYVLFSNVFVLPETLRSTTVKSNQLQIAK